MAIKESYRKKAYDYLKKEIIENRLKSGSAVVEQEIADMLNMSRTPVREAIKDLESEGLLINYPYLGTLVSTITIDDIEEICELRIILEVWALKKSINRIKDSDLDQILLYFNDAMNPFSWEKYHFADMALHNLIVEKAGSRRIKDMLETLDSQVARFRVASAAFSTRWEESYKEHKEIIELIRKKDLEECIKSLTKHLKLVEAGFIEACINTKFTK